jgi:hypothetical protein
MFWVFWLNIIQIKIIVEKLKIICKLFDMSVEILKFLETKNWSIVVWAACVKKIIFLNFFFQTSELYISQAF